MKELMTSVIPLKLTFIDFWDSYINSDSGPLISILVTAIVIYITLILFTRIAGKRSFSKMSSFDFAITISIGSVIAATILNKSVTLIQGILGLALLFILQMMLAYLRRFEGVQDILDNKPLLLMEGRTLLHENMLKAKVTESDIKGKLREANVITLDQVKAVIFESTGDISVLHSENSNIDFEDYILSDVIQ